MSHLLQLKHFTLQQFLPRMICRHKNALKEAALEVRGANCSLVTWLQFVPEIAS